MATRDMIRIPEMAGRKVAVLGLARSGVAAAQALMASGADVWAWDDSSSARDAAHAAGIPLRDLHACDWSRPEALVLSPGIPHSFPKPHPVAALAKDKNCPILGDIELMARANLRARFIGITGTNGKSTTTALIGHVLRSAGRRAEVGGNLGTAALDLAPLGENAFYVLEVSSYQLELTHSLVFDAAVLLNIAPDHLDRHGGMKGYIAAKARIFDRQDSSRTAVIGIDDPDCQDIFATLQADGRQKVVPVSAMRPHQGGVYADYGWLIDDIDRASTEVLELARATRLPGQHNWHNAAAAYAACRAVGLDADSIAAGLVGYPGLAHRQELIAAISDIRYVNDSKATNADAAAKALACYSAIYWIVGGRAKETGLDGLEPFYPNIVHAFLIGEAADRFAVALEGQVACTKCGTLPNALAAAHRMAQGEQRPGAVVLLSPACASFDQYRNFEERGDAFRDLVRALESDDGASNSAASRRRVN
ncbi:MAG: UDP-N-acetylmuramoyl-L-alanine--D-glutamate ligase [Dongiaceae bacterium]